MWKHHLWPTVTTTGQKTFTRCSSLDLHRFREDHTLLMQEVPSNPCTWNPTGGHERAGGCRGNAAPGGQFCLPSYFSIRQWSGALWFCSGASLSRAYYLTEWTSPRHVGDVSRSGACWVGSHPGDCHVRVTELACRRQAHPHYRTS